MFFSYVYHLEKYYFLIATWTSNFFVPAGSEEITFMFVFFNKNAGLEVLGYHDGSFPKQNGFLYFLCKTAVAILWEGKQYVTVFTDSKNWYSSG